MLRRCSCRGLGSSSELRGVGCDVSRRWRRSKAGEGRALLPKGGQLNLTLKATGNYKRGLSGRAAGWGWVGWGGARAQQRHLGPRRKPRAAGDKGSLTFQIASSGRSKASLSQWNGTS